MCNNNLINQGFEEGKPSTDVYELSQLFQRNVSQKTGRKHFAKTPDCFLPDIQSASWQVHPS